MLEVTKLWCRSFDLDRIDLFWEIGNVGAPRSDEDPHEILSYEFYILRAGDSPLGPYHQVGGPFVDRYLFRDVQVNLLHKWRQYHYKLRVRDRRTGEAQEFGPTSSSAADPDRIALEIQRQEDMLLREFIGRRAWLFPLRTFGPRCSCFDSTMGRITRSNHKPCFGTGFLGGYMSPIEIHIQIDPSGNKTDQTSLQERQQTDTMGRMVAFPPVSPRDIIVESENRRWRVIQVNQTERLRAVVRQELQLHEIPRGDVEYTLPIKIDERALVPAASRNFTNPQNIDKPTDGSVAASLVQDETEMKTIPVYDEIPGGIVDGSNAIFTLTNLPEIGSLNLYLNGIVQVEGTHYSLVHQSITFLAGYIPLVGDVLRADYATR